MAKRSDQRRDAAFAVYQAELNGRELNDVLDGKASAYTRALAHAAADLAPELDDTIAYHAQGWTIERIAPLEKAIMRVALVEMLHPDAVPADVPITPQGAVAEAVKTTKTYAGEKSPSFVNGILAAVLRDMREPEQSKDPAA